MTQFQPDLSAETEARAAITRHRHEHARRLPAQMRLAHLWRERGDYRRAGLLLALTLAAAEHRYGPDSPAVAAVSNEWGVLT